MEQEEYSNIFYFDRINSIGGVETMFFEIAKKYCDKDITIFYNIGDPIQIKRLKQYVRVKKYKNQLIKCKKAFFNYNLRPIDNVTAEKYYSIIHADYKALGMMPAINPKIDEYIGVSQAVCDSFTELTGKPCTLCYNPITIEKPKRVLNLISATRLTREKGKDRILKLAEALDKAGIPYIWTIFTNDTQAIDHPRIIFMKPELNIRDYIAKADYTVQLSDTEAYCYTMIESLLLGVPIIVTEWKCLKELEIDNRYGFILPLDMSNIPVWDIYNKEFNFIYKQKEDIWLKFLAPDKSTYQEELNTYYEVEALPFYKNAHRKDAELGYIPEPGERWVVKKDRLDVLLGDNSLLQKFVKVIRKIEKDEVIQNEDISIRP